MSEIDKGQFIFHAISFCVMRVPWILDSDRMHIYEQLYAQMVGLDA